MIRVRGPLEIAESDRIWFQPGLDRLAALPSDPDPRLRAFFTPDQPVFLARAPGRLDVMGGIADYSGAQVLGLPLDRSAQVLAQRRTSPRCEIATRRGGRWDWFDTGLDAPAATALADAAVLHRRLASNPAERWAAYLLGVVQVCRRAVGAPALASLGGFRLLVDSTVPEGKGVASSAAIEVAAMSAVAASCGVMTTRTELATACQWIENHVVGAPCGIMDQITSACGLPDRLLLLRCQPGTIEGHIEVPAGYRFFGIESGIRHEVAGADYGTVRTAAFMGYRIIAEAAGLAVSRNRAGVRVEDPLWQGYLANIPLVEFQKRFEAILPSTMIGADFLERYGGITDSVTRVEPDRSYPVKSATAHPIGEQARVSRFIALVEQLPRRPEAAEELGSLMYEAHESYGACGLGSDGTDRLVALVAEAGPKNGLFGAKITGGGSGGTVAVFGAAESASVVEEIAARYRRETGRAGEVFSRSSPGAAETGVLRLA